MGVPAQIVPDNTTNPVVTSLDVLNNTIDFSDQAGPNLFHSFSQFSVPTNESAIFSNTPNLINIFSRVTGGNVSTIDGLIQTNGTASLFLLNPNGILIWPQCRTQYRWLFLGQYCGSQLSTNAAAGATGTGGSLRIETGTLNLLGGGQLSADTFGAGNGGTVSINATEIFANGVVLNQGGASGIFVDVRLGGTQYCSDKLKSACISPLGGIRLQSSP